MEASLVYSELQDNQGYREKNPVSNRKKKIRKLLVRSHHNNGPLPFQDLPIRI